MKTAQMTMQVPLGFAHSTGLIPYDINRDGHTDLVLAPSLFNTGADQPMTVIVSSGNSLRVDAAKIGGGLTTGFVKDWIIADMNGDDQKDLVLIDHGLELPQSQGGFQYGVDRILTWNGGVLADTGTLVTPRAFHHAGAVADMDGDGDNDLLLQQFANYGSPFVAVWENEGTFVRNDQSAPDQHIGAVAVAKTETGPLVVTASYIVPNQHSTSKVEAFTYDGAALHKVSSVPFPEGWNTQYGAYRIVTGDFAHTGHPDLVVFAESDLATGAKKWLYLRFDGASYADATINAFGTYDAPKATDKFIPFDVNGDGHLDLLGFSYSNRAAQNDELILINNGFGQFTRANTHDLVSGEGIFVPQFTTDASGAWVKMEGFFYAQSAGNNQLTISVNTLDRPLVGAAMNDGQYGISGALRGQNVIGNESSETAYGTAGQDFLRGNDGNDVLYGGDSFDDMHGNKGEDTLTGGRGDDWVVGGQGSDLLFGGEGHDIVYGNMGDDLVYGGVGNDVMRGGQHNDLMWGGEGDDWMSGDRGDDTISGGAGSDTFNFFVGAGIDRIVDFAAGDRVQLEGNPSYTISHQGADTIIDLGAGDQMILVGVHMTGSGWIISTV